MVTPKVAVLTPVYNGAEYLREAMESVQSQTYPNLGHFILNNASTDATGEILETFLDRDIPVTVAKNDELLPIGSNWNKCVELGASGTRYFRILCADDTMPPDSIEKMVALAETDEHIAFVASDRATSEGVNEFGWDPKRNVFSGKETLRGCFLNGNGLAPPHVLYRSLDRPLRASFFDESILAFDTEALFYLLSKKDAKMGYIHEPLGVTRRHPGSITQTQVKTRHADFFDWLFLIERYGKSVLSSDEFARYRRAFLRHYIRRLLVWRWRDGNLAAFDWHLSSMHKIGVDLTPLAYLDALTDYMLCKAGMRTRWNQYPQ
jgi:glycosyltransferase involved in cell wall biosynthesis